MRPAGHARDPRWRVWQPNPGISRRSCHTLDPFECRRSPPYSSPGPKCLARSGLNSFRSRPSLSAKGSKQSLLADGCAGPPQVTTAARPDAGHRHGMGAAQNDSRYEVHVQAQMSDLHGPQKAADQRLQAPAQCDPPARSAPSGAKAAAGAPEASNAHLFYGNTILLYRARESGCWAGQCDRMPGHQ